MITIILFGICIAIAFTECCRDAYQMGRCRGHEEGMEDAIRFFQQNYEEQREELYGNGVHPQK